MASVASALSTPSRHSPPGLPHPGPASSPWPLSASGPGAPPRTLPVGSASPTEVRWSGPPCSPPPRSGDTWRDMTALGAALGVLGKHHARCDLGGRDKSSSDERDVRAESLLGAGVGRGGAGAGAAPRGSGQSPRRTRNTSTSPSPGQCPRPTPRAVLWNPVRCVSVWGRVRPGEGASLSWG